ncbi:MAG TPA: endo-1,4-beta-xylanase [Acidimicrobiales bacterium]
MLVASALVGCTPPPGSCPEAESGLRDLTAVQNLDIGTAYRAQFAQDDRCYDPTAIREFNSLTPEIATFSNRIAAVEGRYDFSEADAICSLAREHEASCQPHNIIWDPQDHPEWGIVPDWIRSQPPDQRRQTMIRYVHDVVTHFSGQVEAYTLVNEAFDGAGQVTGGTWNTLGDDSFIVDAFRAARLADPDAKLFYNDWGAEDINPKSDAIFALAQRLHAETVPVEINGTIQQAPLLDGVGLQMHIGIGPGQAPDPTSVAANIARLSGAGLLVRITEMDVRLPVAEDGTATDADLQRQRELYDTMVQTCINAPNCSGITFWGFTDAHSWITENQSSFPGQGAAHPFDRQYRPKPAYQGIKDAMT